MTSVDSTNSTTVLAGDVPLPAGYRADWALFCDWCAAIDEAALPAATETLVAFFEAHPAAAGTQRRRYTAIRAAHTAAGQPTPGLAAAENALVARRSQTVEHRQLGRVLTALPTTGWTAGLLGRRDALLLVLTQIVGLEYTQIERLQRGHLHTRHVPAGPPALEVTTAGRSWRIPAIVDDPRSCPVAVYLRWARLQSFFDRRPSTAALAAALRREPVLTADHIENYTPPTAPRFDGPLLPEIDRWGGITSGRHVSIDQPRLGMTPRTASRLVAAHLAGTAAPYTLTAPRPALPPPEPDPAPEPALLPDSDPQEGLRKRAEAQQQLDVVDGLLEGVGSRVDELDARIRAILGADATGG